MIDSVLLQLPIAWILTTFHIITSNSVENRESTCNSVEKRESTKRIRRGEQANAVVRYKN